MSKFLDKDELYSVEQKKPNQSWKELIEKLRNEYTVSIKDCCKALKVNKPWAKKYIFNNVDAIKLSNSFPSKSGKAINWQLIASIQLGKELNGLIYYNKMQIEELIRKSIVKITKQTKSVPIELLIERAKYDDFIREYDLTKEKYEKYINDVRTEQVRYNQGTYNRLVMQYKSVYRKYLSEEGERLVNVKCNYADKNAIASEEYTEEILNINLDIIEQQWFSARDMKQYGDDDAEVYKKIFEDGYLKIELEFCLEDDSKSNTKTDGENKSGRKVYYATDPEWLECKLVNQRIIIPEKDWLKLKGQLLTRWNNE